MCILYIYIYIWFRYMHMCLWWVIQLCLILSDSMDCSPPGFSIHGIFHARILEWVAISSPGNLPDPGSNPHLFHLLHWQADSLPLCHLGSIYIRLIETYVSVNIYVYIHKFLLDLSFGVWISLFRWWRFTNIDLQNGPVLFIPIYHNILLLIPTLDQ